MKRKMFIIAGIGCVIMAGSVSASLLDQIREAEYQVGIESDEAVALADRIENIEKVLGLEESGNLNFNQRVETINMTIGITENEDGEEESGSNDTEKKLTDLMAELNSIANTDPSEVAEDAQEIVEEGTEGNSTREIELTDIPEEENATEFLLDEIEEDTNKPYDENILEFQLETGEVVLTSENIISAEAIAYSESNDNDDYYVKLKFDETGTKILSEVTSTHIGEYIYIVLNGTVISAPRVNEPILGNTIAINGNFTKETATELAESLSQ